MSCVAVCGFCAVLVSVVVSSCLWVGFRVIYWVFTGYFQVVSSVFFMVFFVVELMN